MYLAGMGVSRPGKGGATTNRGTLSARGLVTVNALFGPPRQASRQLSQAQSKHLKRAFVALGTFGGIGARARRGFGSLSLTRLSVDGLEKPSSMNTAEDLVASIRRLLDSRLSERTPPYTALSKQARVLVVIGRPRVGADKRHNFVGSELQRFRSFQNRLGPGLADHDLMRAWMSTGSRPERPPARAVFGMPHNYRFSSLHRANAFVEPSGELDRRASPLLLHIHQLGGLAAAVLTFLPAQFLPRGTQIELKTTGQRAQYFSVPREDVLWRPINEFLDVLVAHGPRSNLVEAVREVRV